jgi:hypothetical protein
MSCKLLLLNLVALSFHKTEFRVLNKIKLKSDIAPFFVFYIFTNLFTPNVNTSQAITP